VESEIFLVCDGSSGKGEGFPCNLLPVALRHLYRYATEILYQSYSAYVEFNPQHLLKKQS
jgi:hypothetical protein